MMQRCTTFLGKGPQCIIFSALEDKIISWTFECRV